MIYQGVQQMSLRLIYGRAGSGKSQFCLNEIKQRIDQKFNKTLVLLVPEQYSFQTEKNLIKTVGAGGILKTEVLSFRRMAYRVFNEVGGITYPHVNSASKCMLIYKILENMKDNFKIFSKVSAQNGFVNTISEMISELKRYNVTPQDLENALQYTDNELLKDKLAEISVIYNEFERTLHEKYRDTDDDLTLLAEKLDKSIQFNDSEIWIDSFSGFTPQEYKVISKLLQKAAMVNISMCTDCINLEGKIDDTDIFSPVKKAANKLLKLASENNIGIAPSINLSCEPLYRFTESTELAHLEKNYFSFPFVRFHQKTDNIHIFTSLNIYSEIENTAQDIVRLCRDCGMRYREIAVVTGNLGIYERLVEIVFSEYGIPIFIDTKKSITKHPICQLILSLFDIFIDNWSYEAVFKYLKTGLTGVSRENIDYIENYVLACGIRGGKWTQQEDWEYKIDFNIAQPEENTEDPLLNRVNSIRKEIITPLTEFRNRTKGRSKAKEFCSALFEFLRSINVPERIENLIRDFQNSGMLDLAGEYSQIWNILMEVMDQIVAVSDESIGIERFSNLFRIAVNEYKTGLIPPSIDQVQVGSISRSRNHEIKALYILGVNDGNFPSAGTSEGLLSDRDRDDLAFVGIQLASDTRTKAFEEQFQVYSVLTTAGKYLRISYPIADHEGKALRPSIVISRIKKIFPNVSESSDIIQSNSENEYLQSVSRDNPTFNTLVGVMRDSFYGENINPLWKDVFNWYFRHNEWNSKCIKSRKSLLYTNAARPVDSNKIKSLYGNPIFSSVSKFEKYESCPFSYYAEYGLKAKERKIQRFNAPDTGTFMHAVIERFSSLLESAGITWRELDKHWCADTVSEIVDDILEKAQGSVLNSTVRYINLSRRLKRVLVRSVWLIAEHIKRSNFQPVGYEMEFGEKGEFPPIKIELEDGNIINLVGRIDRVDACETEEGTYLRIIDYKSGAKAFKLSDIFYGIQIQLITYMDAIWNNGKAGCKEPVLPGGMLYFRLDDPLIKGHSRLTEDDIEKALMRQLKMRGLLLADVKLIKEMDRDIEGDSLIIPARLNKGDILGRSSAASLEQFHTLRKYVNHLVKSIGEEIMKGDVKIKPYKKKKETPCNYCNYSAFCQFDPQFNDNTYRILNDKTDEEVWSLMSSGETNE